MSVTKVTRDVLDTALPTVSGTADAITLTPATAISAYVAGQTFVFVATAQNTGPVTVAVSALSAVALTKRGALPLVAGDILSGALVTVVHDGTRFQLASGVGAAELAVIGDVNAIIGLALL
jgi:hypothetical protein